MFKKIGFTLLLGVVLLACNQKEIACTSSSELVKHPLTDSLLQSLNWPSELTMNVFTGPDLTPSPACMAVAATGEVFVGVDMMGSLGKEINKGFIKRFVDCNHDGIMDSYTEFAAVDNPRGILAVGKQLFVLHTTFSAATKKADNMDLVVFEDIDDDGIADGPAKVLIKNISNSKYLQERGTDHATNGIQMGIDGWIYIAVGDFGFHNATAADGTKLTQLGGGIVRIRPDGTEMEVYTHGLRNIYDVAIDPFMNIFTRGNTNDGGGWNIRFIHQIQSAEYGYPVLFKHFTEEILPALVDVGGGSGTGSLYMNDDRWPKDYNNVPMMTDWGRNQLYLHRVTENGASFTQDEETFITLPQITDIDVDAAGAMYLSAWDGAGYSGSPDKGYVVRAMPKDLEYVPFPRIEDFFWTSSVVELLKSGNAKTRLSAQHELIRRGEGADAVWSLANDSSQSLETRVASIFTFAQLTGAEGIDQLVILTEDTDVQEFVLRALADRLGNVGYVPLDPFLKGLESASERVKAAAIIGLGRLGNKGAISKLLKVPVPSSFKAPVMGAEGPHAKPNGAIILPHLAVKALLSLNAVEDCITALDSSNSDLALWAMRYMHSSQVVDAMITAHQKSDDIEFKHKLLNNLARIYYKEAPYDTSWWWSTRPDTHGPYYKVVEWDYSPVIRSFLMNEWKKASADEKEFYTELNSKYRLVIDAFGILEKARPKEDMPLVDLDKIKNKKGQIGESSIEDILIALKQIKGDAKKGEKLFKTQACFSCHSIKANEVMKGPFMGQIGSIMNREMIAESILKPNASISQGFSTVQIKTKNGDLMVGFITQESATDLSIRNIAGIAKTLEKSDIEERKELETSMMPSGLVNALSFEEMASLVTFLEQQK
ncbi:MAG: c-type cytochrome [Flavobacteriaceae bacterium]